MATTARPILKVYFLVFIVFEMKTQPDRTGSASHCWAEAAQTCARERVQVWTGSQQVAFSLQYERLSETFSSSFSLSRGEDEEPLKSFYTQSYATFQPLNPKQSESLWAVAGLLTLTCFSPTDGSG